MQKTSLLKTNNCGAVVFKGTPQKRCFASSWNQELWHEIHSRTHRFHRGESGLSNSFISLDKLLRRTAPDEGTVVNWDEAEIL